MLEHPAIGRGDRVVRLIDDDQVELIWRQAQEAAARFAANGRDRREHDARIGGCAPASLLDAHREPRSRRCELGRRLLEELFAMSEHEHSLLDLEERGQRREHDGLPRPGGQRNEHPPRAFPVTHSNAVEAFELIRAKAHRERPARC